MSEYIYQGDVPLELGVGYTSIVEGVYAGAIGLNLVPGHELIIHRIYDGQISVAVVPNAIYALAVWLYLGELLVELWPTSPYDQPLLESVDMSSEIARVVELEGVI